LFIIPLALTLFLYILVANWIEILPLGLFPVLHGANADLNQTLAMGLIVILVVQWYSVRVQGWAGYFRRFTKPFELPLAARIDFGAAREGLEHHQGSPQTRGEASEFVGLEHH